jgi:hypothetical protein
MMEIIGAILIILVIPIVLWDANNGFVVRWRRLALLAALLVGVAFLVAPARAQHVHPDETIHDPKVSKFYETWTTAPRRIVSCCSKKDCYAAQIRRGPNGLEYLHKWTGTWAALPPSVIEQNQVDPRESPNSENHVCASEHYPENVFCATLGSGT